VLSVLKMSTNEFWHLAKMFVGDADNLRRLALESSQDLNSIVPAWERVSDFRWRHLGTVHGEERFLDLPVHK
jgi:hypothetical protein